MTNRFISLILDDTDDLETGTGKKSETCQTIIIDMNIESTRPKTKLITRPSVIINQHPENQHNISRKRVVPGTRMYKDSLNEIKSKDNSKQSNKVIFGDSIPRTTRISEFNYYLKSSEEKFKCIPGASAHEMKFYGEPLLILK